jgi:hypothetical protein
MEIINTAKLLSPTEQKEFDAIARKHGMHSADLAEIAIKQALYSHISINGPAKVKKKKEVVV